MADTKKYLSKINKDGITIYVKDTDAQERILALEQLSVTYQGTTYTLSELLTGIASLMAKTVVVNE